MLKYSVQIRNPAAGSGPTLTCSPYPRVASLSKTFFFCGEAGVWHQTRRPAASHWSLPTPSRVSSSSVVVELMWCSDSNALRAPHMTELYHQGPYIRNSAGLLFLLLTACVFIVRMPGISAHSCFSSTAVFS